jgi:hypothetical protein
MMLTRCSGMNDYRFARDEREAVVLWYTETRQWMSVQVWPTSMEHPRVDRTCRRSPISRYGAAATAISLPRWLEDCKKVRLMFLMVAKSTLEKR